MREVYELTFSEHFRDLMLIFWLNAVADRGTNIDDAVSFSSSLDDTSKARKESLWVFSF
jgi:hypothetical protein